MRFVGWGERRQEVGEGGAAVIQGLEGGGMMVGGGGGQCGVGAKCGEKARGIGGASLLLCELRRRVVGQLGSARLDETRCGLRMQG